MPWHKSKNQKNKNSAQRSGTLFFRCMSANLINLYKAGKSFAGLLEKTNDRSLAVLRFLKGVNEIDQCGIEVNER